MMMKTANNAAGKEIDIKSKKISKYVKTTYKESENKHISRQKI